MAKQNERKIDTGIIQRGESYRFTVYQGYDANGKQIRKTSTFTPPTKLTQKQADKLAKEEYINFCNRCKGLYALKDNMRFSELYEEYTKIYAPNKLKESTFYNYNIMVNYHLLNYFGHMKLKDIHPPTINNFFATYTIKTKKEKQPLSNTTGKKLLTILQSIFKFATTQEYLKESPCRNIILPKKQVTGKKLKHVAPDDLSEFLGYFEGYSMLNTFVKLLLHTGMRSGEALALQWDSIDFNNNLIYIRYNLSDVGGKHELTSTKTATSTRTICMNNDLKELLLIHYEEQNKLIQMLGNTFEHPEMTFTSLTGGYKDRGAMLKSFKSVLEDTKFNYMTLHMLRHTNATLLVNNGVDLKIISSHLGHSEINITANTYVAVTNNSMQQTANIMESILNTKPTDNQNTKNSKPNGLEFL